MACCWFYIGYEPNGWVIRQHLAEIEHVGNDVVKIIPIYKSDPTYRVPGGDRGDGDPSEFWSNPLVYEWISSFYWAITTMTTIGYGDISAVSSRERAFSCAVEIMGCCFFAWSTGLITSLLSDTPYCVDRFKSTMDELEEFTSSRGLNDELVQKMKSFYMLKFPTMRIYDEHAVIDGLPKGLARAVKMELFQDVLNHCPLFFGMNVGLPVRNSDGKQTLSLEDVGVSVAGDVCTRLQTLYKTEGLELTAEGDLPDALYILRSGKLNVSTRGHDLFVAQSGDILGEMALLGFSKDGRRLRTSKCLTMCELCYITKDSLEELLLVGGFQVPLRRMLACYVEGVFVCVLCADIYIECVCLAFSVCAERRPEHAYPRILHVTDSIDAYTDDIFYCRARLQNSQGRSRCFRSVLLQNFEESKELRNRTNGEGRRCVHSRTHASVFQFS